MIVKTKTTHGMRRSRLYNIWSDMKSRCSNQSRHMYYIYGGKGIRVCNEWEESFLNFYEWSKTSGYKNGLTIDRIDGNKDYSPDNCRWATSLEQVRNRSVTIFIEHNGEIKTLKEWSVGFMVNYHTAYNRYKKGFSFNEIFKKNKEMDKQC